MEGGIVYMSGRLGGLRLASTWINSTGEIHAHLLDKEDIPRAIPHQPGKIFWGYRLTFVYKKDAFHRDSLTSLDQIDIPDTSLQLTHNSPTLPLNMDLTPLAIPLAIHPTAAFTTLALPTPSQPTALPWPLSDLNPATRINSLTPILKPNWRLDGCSAQGTQFHTIPLSKPPPPPLFITTTIPLPSAHPTLSHLLDLPQAFSHRGPSIQRLGVAQHVLRALEHYSSRQPSFTETYRALPFGSQIVISRLHKDVSKCHITLLRNTQLEHALLTPSALAALAPEIPATDWPEEVDITSLTLVRQLHDSVCVVRLPSSGSDEPRELVMKAVTGDPKYMYHEMISLLQIPEHDNIIRPLYLATKKCGFGGKEGVVGMLLPFHRAGSLRDVLPARSIAGALRVSDQVRWARGVARALAHVVDQGKYYSDLRVDNVVVDEDGEAVLVDFEQRGVWAGFSAPEVACVENMAIIAMSANGEVPVSVRAEYRAKMDRFVPGWRDVGKGAYKRSTEGFALGWLAMDVLEREAAMVYMLGRALWCIFEGVGMPERAVWRQGGGEGGVEFPEYRKARKRERELIDRCTRGRVGERREQVVVRMGGRIVLKEGDGTESADAVQRAAKEWWIEELERGERFLEKRERKREERSESGDMREERSESGDMKISSVFGGRPRLEEVLHILESWEM
ncbi:hypothetical protein V495_03443 [Pseudogymnoascus sp. VKM F-4514 (FW-929)]|nr:hypothetical protein V495_03443 [Pseudogymnoascus sp. VKM F-4514 (FW-929)]KFY62541.1 hypothetical protein V497_02330 [Pseudogymnoascus sp. VKM F-4516 (FW-969)]